MIFDDKISSLGLFKSPSIQSYSDPFGIVEDTRSIVSPIYTLTSSLTFILESTSSWSTPTKTVTSPMHYSQRNDTLETPYLPWWVVKIIESTGTDIGNMLIGR